MLALGRQLPRALEQQRTARGWPSGVLREESRLLTGETVLLLGFGAIARRLAEPLAPFRVTAMALRRHAASGASHDPPHRAISGGWVDRTGSEIVCVGELVAHSLPPRLFIGIRAWSFDVVSSITALLAGVSASHGLDLYMPT